MFKHFFSFFLLLNAINTGQAQQGICEVIGTFYDWAYCLDESSSSVVALLNTNIDASSGAIGETGIALSSNINAVFYNSARMVFNKNEGGLSLTYAPWFRNLGITDIYLTNLTGFYKIGKNQAVGGAVRYSSLGEVNYTGFHHTVRFTPREIFIDIAYSVKLTDRFSAGLTAKYIQSNLFTGVVTRGKELKTGKAIAADLSVFYTQKLSIAGIETNFNAGLSVSNIGNKISYFSDKTDKDFLPANLGIGIAYDLNFENDHKITIAYDANKLLIPTPKADGSHSDKSVIAGMFTSFTDAPFKEELAEIRHSLGLEGFIKIFEDGFGIIRTGLFNEHITKGNRKYVTFGLGFQYKPVELAISRIFDDKGSSLRNTYKGSLLFHF